MDEISSFVKKIRYIFIVKINDFDLSKYQIYFVVCGENWFLKIKKKKKNQIYVYYIK